MQRHIYLPTASTQLLRHSTAPPAFLASAGTALGDPIEVGALAAVIKRGPGSAIAPTELAAAKSLYGHAETAAGVVGMMRAAGRLQGHARAGILHLRSLNAYVEGALASSPGTFAASRQAAPGPLPVAAAMHAGCSAFAFQGTNAHAVLGSRPADALALADGVPAAARQQPASGSGTAAFAGWQRRRFWYLPASHQLLFRVAAAGGGAAAFEVALGRTPLAYLWEHQVREGVVLAGWEHRQLCPAPGCFRLLAVPLTWAPDLVCSNASQVQGRVLVPAAAMLEASRAATQQLVNESAFVAGSNTVVLAGASIPAPLILPTASASGTTAALPVVRCTVTYGSSAAPAVQLQSRAAASGAAATHLKASLCSHVLLPVAAASRPASSGSRALSALLSPAAGAAAAPAPLVACGGMQLAAEHLGPGYHAHPAALDATLHLGVFAVPAGSGTAPRVPVAAAYFHAPLQGAHAAGGSVAWPLLRCDAATAGSTTASYSLLPCGSTAGASPAFTLDSLQSRALAGAAGTAGPAALAAGLASYRIQYAAHSAAVAAAPAAGRPAAVSLATPSGRLALLQRPGACVRAGVLGASHKALRALQQAAPGSSFHLSAVCGAGHLAAPQHHASSSAAAAMQAMLKAAAAEAPASAALPSSTLRSHLLPATLLAAAAPAGDVFAAPLLEGSVWQLPQLCSDGPETEARLAGTQLAGGGVSVSGGMGALGLLLASWAAAAQGDGGSGGGITLWGRSASGQLLPASLVAAGCLVTAAMCDAAAAADMAAAADRQRSTAVYVHAGEGAARKGVCSQA